MLITKVIDFFTGIIQGLLSFINIPHIPDELMVHFDEYIDLIFGNASHLLTFIVPVGIIRYGIPLVLVIISIKYVYQFVMWIIKKIPMAGMS